MNVRWLTGLVLLPAISIGTGSTLALVWRSRLPATLPQRGSAGTGQPVVGTISVDSVSVGLLGTAIAVWLLGATIFLLNKHFRAAVLPTVLVVTTVLPLALLAILAPALDATSPEQVGPPSLMLLAAVPLAIVLALAVGLLLAGTEVPDLPAAGPLPAGAAVTPIGAGERVLWSERQPVWIYRWLAAALTLGGVVATAVLSIMLGPLIGLAGVAPVVAAVALEALGRYSLRVDEHAVRVRLGPVRRLVRLDTVERADTAELDTVTWLVRGSLRGLASGMSVLWPGRVLRLTLSDGSTTWLTCRAPDTVAGLINGLRARGPVG
ncbi:hypothetical protein [Amycolatopsis suaedae]|uniref:Uncharacterized protein n=1 Tax=Amycolatopsis suaedae TaxID=2510978 RepID=A0A4Q7JE35_9PSEU|nr:hypothetical protein [Amycolatopsis suaedae]RZQ65707.1 hypothetical protein EWH70_01010 [Amycolatopsis suaedae]